MDTREKMTAVLARWKESGESLRAFGKREGVSYSKLIYWRRRLEEKPRGPEKVELATVKVVADEPASAKPDPIGVWLPNGIALEIPPGVPSADLARVVETLSGC